MQCRFYAVATIAATAFCAPVFAEAPPMPPAPTPPADISFTSQAEGRRLLFAAYDAYRNAPALSFTAHWSTVRADGKGGAAGAEYLSAQTDGGRAAITTETTDPNRSIRRAITGTDYLLATDFEDRGAKSTRQFVRLPVDPGTTLQRSLQAVQFNPRTMAAALRITPDWTPRNALVIYRSDQPAQAPGEAVVVEVDSPAGPQNARTVRTARFTLRESSHLLTRYEEWITPQSPVQKPSGKSGPRPAVPTYRREDYDATSTRAVNAAVFSQRLPSGYVEQPLPSVNLPPPPQMPQDATPRALAALRRWREAQERPFALHVEAQTDVRATPRTPDARQVRANRQSVAASYSVWLEQPDKMRLRVSATPEEPASAKPLLDLIAISDGTQMSIADAASGNRRVVAVQGNALGQLPMLRPNQMLDNELMWLLSGPPRPEQLDKVELDDSGEVLTLVRKNQGGRQGDSETTQTWTVTLGADYLPRAIESRTEADTTGLFDRDQPPIVTTSTRVQLVEIDSEPATNAFVLPLPPPKPPKPAK